jgi:hypothetical protein
MSNDQPVSLSGDPGSLYSHHNHRNRYTIISTQCYQRVCAFVNFYPKSKLNTRVTPYVIELITQPAASALSPWTCPVMLAVSTARTRPAAGSQGRTPGRTCRLAHMLPRGGTAVAPWQQGAGWTALEQPQQRWRPWAFAPASPAPPSASSSRLAVPTSQTAVTLNH